MKRELKQFLLATLPKEVAEPPAIIPMKRELKHSTFQELVEDFLPASDHPDEEGTLTLSLSRK